MLSLLKKKKNKLPARLQGNSCLNCNDALDGKENFCPNCGQRNNINQLSFKLFIDEFFGDMFSYDSRLWGTVFPLILKPGKVAYEFVAGKRKEYVNPFRTYLTVSLIFFIIYGLLNTINQYNSDGTNDTKNTFFNFNSGADNLTQAETDSIIDVTLNEIGEDTNLDLDSIVAANNIPLDSVRNFSIDSIENNSFLFNSSSEKITAFWKFHRKNKDFTPTKALDSLGYENTFWNRFYYDKAKDTQGMIDDKAQGINDKMFSGLSIAIFLFLPVFALFLKLIYIRRKYTYMEHMVFVFYSQSVFFLLLLLFVIINFFISDHSSRIVAVSLGLFAIYLLLAMKYFYKQSWIKTIFKYILANFSFMIMAVFGVAILALMSFIFY